jgi:hypothetical protein
MNQEKYQEISERMNSAISTFIREIPVDKLRLTEEERKKYQDKEKTRGAFLIQVSQGVPETPGMGGLGLPGSSTQSFS